jgi:hypothetical protein
MVVPCHVAAAQMQTFGPDVLATWMIAPEIKRSSSVGTLRAAALEEVEV